MPRRSSPKTHLVDAAGDLIVRAESLNDFEFALGLNLIQDAFKTYLALGGKPDYTVSDGRQIIYTGDVVLKDDADETTGTPGNHYMYMAEYDDGLVIYGQTMDLATVDFNTPMWFNLGSLEQADTSAVDAEVEAGSIVEVLKGHLPAATRDTSTSLKALSRNPRPVEGKLYRRNEMGRSGR